MKKKVIKITETDIKNIVNKLLKENHPNDDLYPNELEPNEEDAFISTNGWSFDASFGGSHLGEFDEIDQALDAMRSAYEDSPNYKPTLWYVSDHGNHWAIDLDGKEIDY